MRRFAICMSVLLALAAVPAAAGTGGGRAQEARPPEGVVVPAGYVLDELVTGLDFPTGIAMGDGRVWVSEAGIMGQTPKVKEISPTGAARTILAGGDIPGEKLKPPFIDVTYQDGWLWLSHRQPGVHGWVLGAISKFRPDDPAGTFTTVLRNLPAAGDHHTNEIVFDPSGRAYFSQGTATNSSVVGLDNLFITGWLDMFPKFHDFPATDVVLSGVEYTTRNPLTDDPDDEAVTPPFMPFGAGPVDEGTVVQGAPTQGITIGNGTAYSFDPSAPDPTATLRLEAWGLRNPFGVGIDPLSPDTLFVTNNGADIRTRFSGDRSDAGGIEPGDLTVVGSRPIANDYDDLFAVRVGGDEEFLGFPDFFHDPQTGRVLPVTDPLFCADEQLQPDCEHDFVLDDGYRAGLDVGTAFSQFEVHSSANKFGFSATSGFGHRGDLFVAETGAFVPITGAERFKGYKVVRVDRDTGAVSDFIVNVGNTADEVFNPDSFNKPIDVKFADDVMLTVDFGVFEPGLGLAKPGTGKVWLTANGTDPIDRFRGCTLTGTDGADVLRGTDRRDVICGGGGDDVIVARGGDDAVFAGDGDDRVFGGDGNDMLRGGAGDDQLWGNRGADQLHGQAGADRLNGGRFRDHLFGGAGDDDVRGGRGNDMLRGGTGDDDVYGDPGRDRLHGDAGDDLLHGSQGDDRHDGGDGTDRCNGAAGFDSAVHCERLLNMEEQIVTATLEPLNDSGATGTARLRLRGRRLTVSIEASGLVPGQPHAQHLHGIAMSTCPPPRADTNGDGLVNTVEGQPFYGEILASLTVTGGTSPASALAVARFPVADAQGRVDYQRTFTVDDTIADNLAKLQVVQHGIDVNGNGMYDFDGAGPSVLDPSLPAEATIPADCGTLS